jgi:hypothetical protein
MSQLEFLKNKNEKCSIEYVITEDKFGDKYRYFRANTDICPEGK